MAESVWYKYKYTIKLGKYTFSWHRYFFHAGTHSKSTELIGMQRRVQVQWYC